MPKDYRSNINFDASSEALLRRLREVTGASRSELVRRSLRAYADATLALPLAKPRKRRAAK